LLVKIVSAVLIRKRKAEIQEKNASINEKQTLNDKGALHTFNRCTIRLL
jgi:hypothetical protein